MSQRFPVPEETEEDLLDDADDGGLWWGESLDDYDFTDRGH